MDYTVAAVVSLHFVERIKTGNFTEATG